MKLYPLQASLLALAVFAAAPAGMAQAQLVLAQADTGGASQEENAVRKFLASGQNIAQLDDKRLEQRLARAKRLRDTQGLSPDLDQMLQQQISAIEAELARRQQQGGDQQQAQQPTPKLETPPLPPATNGDQPDQQAQDQQPQKHKHRKQQQDQAQQDQTQQGQEQPPQVDSQSQADQPPQEQPAQDQQPAQRKPQKQQQAQDTQPASQDQQPQQNAGGSPEVAAFLQSVRPAGSLGEAELRQQMKQAMQLAQSPDISPEQRSQLREVIKETRTALQSAPQGADQQPPVAEQQKPQQKPVTQQQVQQPQQGAGGSPEVAAFLAAIRPAASLSEDELRQQMSQAMQLAQSPGISPEQRNQLRQVIRDTRTALQSAPQGGDQQPPVAQQQPQQQKPVTEQQAQQPPQQGGGGSPEASAFLGSVRPATSLSEDELRRQMRRAMQLSQSPDISPEQRNQLREVISNGRQAMRTPQDQGQQQSQQPGQQQAQQPPMSPGDMVDPALERQARALLADDTDVRTMKRKQLRKRLSDIRDLLASGQLSPQTTEALRQKLARERMVLRNEVAVDEGMPPPEPQFQPGNQVPQGQRPPRQQNGTGGGYQNGDNGGYQNGNGGDQSGNGNGWKYNNNTNVDVRVILNDRRPPDELGDEDLVRRIDVYRNVVQDDRYDEQQRMRWQQQMEDDRRFLRQRMIAERRQREARLHSGDVQLNFRVEDRYDPNREVPDDVFAAEADDSEIADVLSAPPRRQIQRRYTLNDIENSPDARNSVARIDIDTVHFGFGEGFLREEEIDKLDRIATVLEKILAKNPDEVFLLEGHTDAVGSDQANLILSRQRAEAVKQALVTYYVIPPENLKTVGLGERYLKIPTDQPEAENRRVSLARITALVGQAGN